MRYQLPCVTIHRSLHCCVYTALPPPPTGQLPCVTMRYHALPCVTMRYHALPCVTMRYHSQTTSLLCRHCASFSAYRSVTMRYHALPCATMRYHLPCVTIHSPPHCCVYTALPPPPTGQLPCVTMRYHALPCVTTYHALPFTDHLTVVYTLRFLLRLQVSYHALPCVTMRFHLPCVTIHRSPHCCIHTALPPPPTGQSPPLVARTVCYHALPCVTTYHALPFTDHITVVYTLRFLLRLQVSYHALPLTMRYHALPLTMRYHSQTSTTPLWNVLL